ncbi:MAG: hypothetical protein ACM3RP_07245 [Chitinophagales bacterium]
MERPARERRNAVLRWALGLALAAGLCFSLVAAACEGQPGRGPFTVTGQVVDEAGQPVRGLRLAWLPALPGSLAPDFDNLYYAIQERVDHETETGADGRFAMTEVRDYYLVASHQYLVWGTDILSEPARQPYWRVTGEKVDLNRTPPGLIEVNLVARPAGALRLRVTGPDGRPFEGTLPVAFDQPELQGDELVVTRRFVGGECLQGGLPPGKLRVRVLAGPVAEELKFKNYLTYPAAEGQPVTQVAAEDVREETAAIVEAGRTTEVSLTLR